MIADAWAGIDKHYGDGGVVIELLADGTWRQVDRPSEAS